MKDLFKLHCSSRYCLSLTDQCVQRTSCTTSPSKLSPFSAIPHWNPYQDKDSCTSLYHHNSKSPTSSQMGHYQSMRFLPFVLHRWLNHPSSDGTTWIHQTASNPSFHLPMYQVHTRYWAILAVLYWSFGSLNGTNIDITAFYPGTFEQTANHIVPSNVLHLVSFLDFHTGPVYLHSFLSFSPHDTSLTFLLAADQHELSHALQPISSLNHCPFHNPQTAYTGVEIGTLWILRAPSLTRKKLWSSTASKDGFSASRHS